MINQPKTKAKLPDPAYIASMLRRPPFSAAADEFVKHGFFQRKADGNFAVLPKCKEQPAEFARVVAEFGAKMKKRKVR
jgi:hypothetical protein